MLLLETVRHPGRRSWAGGLVCAIAATAIVASGCGSTTTASEPVATVVVGLWPLAQAAAQIGGPDVRVINVIPPGQDPLTWQPSASERRTIATATTVIEVGGGFQPGFEQAAQANPHTVSLVAPLKVKNPYLWVSPQRMERVVNLIALALVESTPKGAGVTTGLRPFAAQLDAVDAAYTQALAGCASKTIVTVDGAFRPLDGTYPVRVVALAPRAGPVVIVANEPTPPPTSLRPIPAHPNRQTIRHQVAIINQSDSHAVFNESGFPSSYLSMAATQTGAKILTLDPMMTAPTAVGSTYISVLQANLTAITEGLGC